MSILANLSNLSAGMGLGFPAITFQTLTDQTDPMALTNEQASWFGELEISLDYFVFFFRSINFFIYFQILFYCFHFLSIYNTLLRQI